MFRGAFVCPDGSGGTSNQVCPSQKKDQRMELSSRLKLGSKVTARSLPAVNSIPWVVTSN
jgi:hypothetical protein